MSRNRLRDLCSSGSVLLAAFLAPFIEEAAVDAQLGVFGSYIDPRGRKWVGIV
jgi:hypothetical protein